jgi:hypothetical protein
MECKRKNLNWNITWHFARVKQKEILPQQFLNEKLRGKCSRGGKELC